MASKTHHLRYDGYTVGDRLLEGVIFLVEITEDGEALTVGEVTPSKEAETYLENIKWEKFVPAIKSNVQENADHLVSYFTKNSLRLRDELEAFAREHSEEEIEILNEV